MRKIALLVAVAVLVLVTASVVSARCLDEDCRAVRPTATATLLPLWTPTPSEVAPAVLELPTSAGLAAGYPAPPSTATPAGGYPGAPAATPTIIPTSAVSATPTPPCVLLWTLRPAPDAERYLADCLAWHLAHGYTLADICPPPNSAWAYLCAPTD